MTVRQRERLRSLAREAEAAKKEKLLNTESRVSAREEIKRTTEEERLAEHYREGLLLSEKTRGVLEVDNKRRKGGVLKKSLPLYDIGLIEKLISIFGERQVARLEKNFKHNPDMVTYFGPKIISQTGEKINEGIRGSSDYNKQHGEQPLDTPVWDSYRGGFPRAFMHNEDAGNGRKDLDRFICLGAIIERIGAGQLQRIIELLKFLGDKLGEEDVEVLNEVLAPIHDNSKITEVIKSIDNVLRADFGIHFVGGTTQEYVLIKE